MSTNVYTFFLLIFLIPCTYSNELRCIIPGPPSNNICYPTDKDSRKISIDKTDHFQKKYGQTVRKQTVKFMNDSQREYSKIKALNERLLKRIKLANQKTNSLWQRSVRNAVLIKKEDLSINNAISKIYIDNSIRIKEDPKSLSIKDILFVAEYLRSDIFNITLIPNENKFDLEFSEQYINNVWSNLRLKNENNTSYKIGSDKHLNSGNSISGETENKIHFLGGSQQAGGQQVAGGYDMTENKPIELKKLIPDYLSNVTIESKYKNKKNLQDFLNNYIDKNNKLSDVSLNIFKIQPSIISDFNHFDMLSKLLINDKEILDIVASTRNTNKLRNEISDLKEWQRSKFRKSHTDYEQKVFIVEKFLTDSKGTYSEAPRIDTGIGHLYIHYNDFIKLEEKNLLKYLMMHESEHIKLNIESSIAESALIHLDVIIKDLLKSNKYGINEKSAIDFRKKIKEVSSFFTNYNILFFESKIDLDVLSRLSDYHAKKYMEMLAILLPTSQDKRLKYLNDYMSVRLNINALKLNSKEIDSAMKLYSFDKNIIGFINNLSDEGNPQYVDFVESINHFLYIIRSEKSTTSKNTFDFIQKSFYLHKWYRDYKNYIQIKKILNQENLLKWEM